MTKSERERIRNLFGGRCAYCGRELGKSFHADHVDPLMRNYPGQAEREKSVTLYPSCRRCNLRKSMFTLEQFRSEISKQPERLRRNSNQFKLAEDFGLVAEIAIPVEFYFERYDPNTEKPF